MLPGCKRQATLAPDAAPQRSVSRALRNPPKLGQRFESLTPHLAQQFR